MFYSFSRPAEDEDAGEEDAPAAAAAAAAAVTRTEEEGGVIFTAGKCPPAPGLGASCELPFGFVWTPMAGIGGGCRLGAPTVVDAPALPPVICLRCLCYLNPYAEYDAETAAIVSQLSADDLAALPYSEWDGTAPFDPAPKRALAVVDRRAG